MRPLSSGKKIGANCEAKRKQVTRIQHLLPPHETFGKKKRGKDVKYFWCNLWKYTLIYVVKVDVEVFLLSQF